MGCDGYREALSARLDGEELPPDQPADLDAHLARCRACRRWQDDAAAVTRRFRTSLADAGVDVTAAVLPAAPGPWRGRLALSLRMVLAGFGMAQLVLSALQVTLLRDAGVDSLHETTVDGATPGHLWHESVAWNIAIGVGFIWAATRRGRPAGIIPILTAFVGVLVLLDLTDLLAGRVEPARSASHGFVVVGYLVVLVLSRFSRDLPPPAPPSRAERARRPGSGSPAPENVVRLPDTDQPAARTRRARTA